ncbi:capsule biosynthesis protein [Halomonas piscis]|uniref:capsule biosynthesis protein n=1 Tax=Halomonas piscis TaxID=3031727 RepID=UPI0028A18842|nr:capsular biosynthesis protein [Halomonas piscis]
MASDTRTFLFLQGVCSPFNARLASRLEHEGHRVIKLHFNAGDIVYWGRQGHHRHLFRGRLEALGDYVQTLWQRYGVTDQIVFGDRRPIHRTAVENAPRAGIRTHVFEEGYFRPFWVTLEREGVNGHSLLPRDPAWFRDAASALPRPQAPRHFTSRFKVRALHDVCYHLAGLANPLVAPHYRNHSSLTAPWEYAGYIRRFTWLRYRRVKDHNRIRSLLLSRRPFFILPLQLNTDAQIRDHSAYANMQEVIAATLASFARHAPSDAVLCIKNHPLDQGLCGYERLVNRLAREYDIAPRVVFLESGDLNRITRHAAGTVTVNSTTGLVALGHGCPTIALGDPIYQLPGLTFQGSLDAFWRAPTPPSATLFACFRRTVMHATQINGGFYNQPGIDLAVEGAAQRLTARTSPLEQLGLTLPQGDT